MEPPLKTYCTMLIRLELDRGRRELGEQILAGVANLDHADDYQSGGDPDDQPGKAKTGTDYRAQH